MNGKSSPKWHGCYPIQATGIIIGAYNFRTAALQLSRKELDYLHLKEFQNCEYDCTSGNIDTITTQNQCHTLNFRLVIKTGQ